MVCTFLTGDEIYKYISNMGNNLTSYIIAIGWKNIYFLTPHFQIVEKEKIHSGDDVELLDYDVSNCEKLREYKIHSNYD